MADFSGLADGQRAGVSLQVTATRRGVTIDIETAAGARALRSPVRLTSRNRQQLIG
ncbi:MAG: hypothetical protein ACJAYX_003965 [Planctomycetota bacterium]|jgi:hypothetical protein